MGVDIWTVRLSAAADADYEKILHWTVDNFGPAQARVYADILSSAIKELCAGPSIVGVKRRSEIGVDICTLHVARKGRKGRHFVMFRVSNFKEQKVIDVLRLLHDSMDLKRHLPPEDPEQMS